MKREYGLVLVFSFLVFVSLLSTSCGTCNKVKLQEGEFKASGMVKKLPNLQGSCAWVVETKDGKQYQALELPREFLVDGQKIKFHYVPVPDMRSKCMTGDIIKITHVKKR